jgi:undecaprenyl-diphosphatase
MSNLLQTALKMDQKLFIALYQVRSDSMNRIINYFTHLGGIKFQSLLVLILLIMPAPRTAGIALAITQIIVTGIIQILKATVARVRPYNALTGVKVLKTEKDYSFPSGHTAAAFTTAITLSRFFPALSLGCLGIAILIGCSRVYIGVHYPSDVIAGSLISSLVTVLALLFL